MKDLIKFLIKVAAVLALIGAACYAIRKLWGKEQERRDRLDEYLTSDLDHSDQPESFYIRHQPEEALKADLEQWKELKSGTKVEISFLISPEKKAEFASDLSTLAISSSYDDKYHVMEATVVGPLDETKLENLAAGLQDAILKTGAVYQGYTFE